MQAVPLEPFRVYPGVVQRVEPYGCFVRLEGPRCRDGLAHASTYVDGEAPPPGVRLWCKVLSVTMEGDPADPRSQRISLSLSLVDQRTGEDLDPLHRVAEQEAQRGGGGGGGGRGGGSDAAPELFSIHKGTVAKVRVCGIVGVHAALLMHAVPCEQHFSRHDRC